MNILDVIFITCLPHLGGATRELNFFIHLDLLGCLIYKNIFHDLFYAILKVFILSVLLKFVKQENSEW